MKPPDPSHTPSRRPEPRSLRAPGVRHRLALELPDLLPEFVQGADALTLALLVATWLDADERLAAPAPELDRPSRHRLPR